MYDVVGTDSHMPAWINSPDTHVSYEVPALFFMWCGEGLGHGKVVRGHGFVPTKNPSETEGVWLYNVDCNWKILKLFINRL